MVQMLSSISTSQMEGKKYILKAWIRIGRCLGVDFLPYMPMVMELLLASISQDVRADVGDIDLENLEERSDIDVIENEDGNNTTNTNTTTTTTTNTTTNIITNITTTIRNMASYSNSCC
jgi:hypothetical protein